MKEDAVVAQVRQARDEHARKFGYDLDAILDDFKKREGKDGAQTVTLPPKRPSAQRA